MRLFKQYKVIIEEVDICQMTLVTNLDFVIQTVSVVHMFNLFIYFKIQEIYFNITHANYTKITAKNKQKDIEEMAKGQKRPERAIP